MMKKTILILVVLVIVLYICFISINEFLKSKINLESTTIICENNILKYKEREYIRNIYINSKFNISCEINQENKIIINNEATIINTGDK